MRTQRRTTETTAKPSVFWRVVIIIAGVALVSAYFQMQAKVDRLERQQSDAKERSINAANESDRAQRRYEDDMRAGGWKKYSDGQWHHD